MFILATFMLPSGNALAKTILPFSSSQAVVICEFADPQPHMPDFDEKECLPKKLFELDPQQRSLWLKITFDRIDNWQTLTPPYGIFVLGKAASRVYFNDVIIGENGLPAANKSEIPGLMDTSFYLPEHLLKETNNQLVMHLSGQHSLVTLGRPIHIIAVGEYTNAQQFMQRSGMLGLVLIGAFFVGCFYFAMVSKSAPGETSYRLFSALCFIAALQLGVELSRGFISYTYPWQDIRLLSVTALSCVFGILLLSYSSLKLVPEKAIHWIYGGSIITLLAVIFSPGFDLKTTAGIFFPMLVSSLQIAQLWYKSRDKSLLNWLLVQLIVFTIILMTSSGFHEIFYFMLVGLLLCYLFARHAKSYRRQQFQMQQDQTLIAKLEYRLAQNQQTKTAAKLDISLGGKTELVEVSNIAFCKAAGDYVELHLLGFDEKLFSGSMKQLESKLPETFLRVHRSYLVNLNEVQTLSTNAQNEQAANQLQLSNGKSVPVSRRLLPAVRDSIKQASIR